MSNAEGFDPEDYGLQEQTEQISRRQRRKFEAAQRESEELKAKLAEMERREIFRDAGINPNDPAAKYFVKGYDGEMSPEAIKAEAIKARLMQGSETPPEEQAGHAAALAAAAGAAPPNPNADHAARLAELGKKTFAPSDDIGLKNHIAEIAALSREAGWRFPTNQ